MNADAANGAPDELASALAWRGAGRGVALATVTSTWGSSPRPAGSLLVVNDRGAMVGSVSGGCIEASVVEAAQQVIADGAPQRLHFGVTDEMAWEVGLACGGEMDVFVERLAPAAAPDDPAWLVELQAERAAKRPVVASVDLRDGSRRILRADEAGDLADDTREALRSDRAVRASDDRFLQPFNPPLRILVVGAVHIAQPLCRMAAEVGYAVTVVDPRGAFATPERFPDVTLRRDWPDEALEALGIDTRTAVVTLTHDPKLDDPALAVALRSPAFYVGSLGSRRTQARRLERLAEQGLDADSLARIRGPVGLAIGARSPSEIAVSILAEITATLRGAD